MAGKYALDTNVIIGLFAGDSTICGHIEESIEFFVPDIVIGELYYGAFRSKHKKQNVSRIDEFIMIFGSPPSPCKMI